MMGSLILIDLSKDALTKDALTFEDYYLCSYEGCEDGNFFLKEFLKFKKIRSPPI